MLGKERLAIGRTAVRPYDKNKGRVDIVPGGIQTQRVMSTWFVMSFRYILARHPSPTLRERGWGEGDMEDF